MRVFTVDSVQMLFPDQEDHLAHWIELGEWYERTVLNEISRHVQPGERFVDVGAHLGNHTLWFATQCQASHVLAIEPHPWTFDVLTQTIRLNNLTDIVTPLKALVHPSWESAKLDFNEDPEAPWMRTMLPTITEHGDTPCITLNEALKDGCSVVKIDVEEMGSQVLASGIDEIDKQGPLISIEAQGEEQQIVAALLEPIGYRNLGQFQKHGTPTFVWTRE